MRRSSEHAEQVAYFNWVAIKANSDIRYKNIYAIPNAGKRSIGAAMYYKAEGLKAGVLDINVDWPCGNYHGLRIEMKARGKTISKAQAEWIARYTRAGYATALAFSFEEAKIYTERYFDLGNANQA